MTRLLIVHHTPSPATAELLDSVVSGAQDPEIGGVEVVCRAALAATASDLLAADGDHPRHAGEHRLHVRRPQALLRPGLLRLRRRHPRPALRPYVHGNLGLEGAVRSIRSITDALGWAAVAAPVEVTGAPDRSDRDACRELGAVVAATIAPDG